MPLTQPGQRSDQSDATTRGHADLLAAGGYLVRLLPITVFLGSELKG
jgi:hypothetical protein